VTHVRVSDDMTFCQRCQLTLM